MQTKLGLYLLIALLLALAPGAQLYAQTGTAKPAELVRRSDGQVQAVGGRYALIVGVNDYSRTGLGNLRFCEGDAQAVYDVLTRYGGFHPSNVTLLQGEQASFENIMLYLGRLSDRALFPGPDTFVLYFSGHGGILEAQAFGSNAEGSIANYLIPADGSSQAEMARFRNIPMDEVQRLLDRSGFKRKVVLLDACRNVLKVDAKGSSLAAFDLTRYALAEGLKVLTGTKPGELSWEDEELGHGVFTYYLLQGLLGSGRDENGVVTLGGLENAVALGLAEYGRQKPGRTQTPQVYGEGLSAIPLTVAPGAEAAQALLRPAPTSWVLTVLKLPAQGQDPEVLKLAEQLLDERGWILDRNKLPDAQWRVFESQLSLELAQNPTALTAWLASYVQYCLGNDQAAMTLAQQAVRLEATWPRGHWLLGHVYYYNLQRYDEAIASYKEAIRLDPQWAWSHKGLGRVYYNLKRYDEAIASWKEAIRLDPQWAWPHNDLGMVYNWLKRYDEAIASYKEAIRLDPQWVWSHNGLGDAYYYLQRYDEAIASYKEAIRLNPNEQVCKDNLKLAQDAKAKQR